MHLQIATLVYNTPDLASNILEQIPLAFVIDNGSSPPIDNAHIRFPTNLYWSGGWNEYLKQVDADYIWMLNSDVEQVSLEMGQHLCSIIEQYPNAAVISGTYNSAHPHMRFRQYTNVREVDWIDWTAGLLSMRAWQEVGSFDSQFLGYGADIDWCKRASDLGYKCLVDNNTRFHHIGQATVKREKKYEQANMIDMTIKLKKKWGKHWTRLFR